jgi:hypothetical protein
MCSSSGKNPSGKERPARGRGVQSSYCQMAGELRPVLMRGYLARRGGQLVDLDHCLIGRRLRALRIARRSNMRIEATKFFTSLPSCGIDAPLKLHNAVVRNEIEPSITHAIGERDINDRYPRTRMTSLLFNDP